MRTLLADLPQASYPADYLLARLPARRARWQTMFAPEGHGGWEGLAQESRWLYGQLSHRLRGELAPLFLYFTLRPLFLFLRALASGRPAAARELLAATLLADGLKEELLAAQAVDEALRALAPRWPGKPPLARLFGQGGIAAVEQAMAERLLREATRSVPAMRPFWAGVVELENSLALAKRLRWQPATPFAYRPGGLTATRRFHRAEQEKVPELVAPVALPVRAAVAQGDWSVEGVLIERLHRQQKRRATMAPAPLVASYLWAAYGTARRLALAGAGRGNA